MREYGIYSDGRIIDVSQRFKQIREENEILDYKDIRARLQEEMDLVYTFASESEEQAKKEAPIILEELGYKG